MPRIGGPSSVRSGVDGDAVLHQADQGAHARRSGRVRALTAALFFAVAAINLSMPRAVAAADGRSDVASTTYTVNPAAGRIDVVVDFTVKNSTPNTVEYMTCTDWYYDPYLGYYPVTYSCPQTTRYYISDTYLWLEHSATNLKVTANSGSSKIVLDKRGSGYDGYKVTFAKIFKGASRRLHVSYRIPSGAPRSESTIRVGKAFVSFCATANGVDSGSTRVILPSAFKMQVDAHSGSVTSSTSGAMTTYATGTLSSPLDFWACFSGDNPAGYASSTFTSPSGREIDLQAWPEDTAWNASVSSQLGQALGELETLIGRGLPGTGPIDVREVASGELGAYAGTFDQQDGVARVGEDYSQPGVVAHELSHAWFNGSLFDARWLSEGSAGWAESTVTGSPCNDPGAAPDGSKPALSSWTFAGPKATATELAAVGYEYDAACYLVSTISDRMGPERLRDVLAALMDHKIAYRSGTTVLAGHPGAEDWRDWLDAVDELGLAPAGSSDLDYAQNLLVKFGAAEDTSSLAARSRARAAYHALVSSVGGWRIPVAVLRPLGAWGFGEATTAMTSAANAYASVIKVNQALPEADALQGPVKGLFESASSIPDLQAAEQRAKDQETAATDVSAAKQALAAPRELLAEVGLIGTDLTPVVAAAVAAVATADLGTAEAKANLITQTLANASQQGILRVGLTFVALLIVCGLLFLLRRRRTAGRRALALATITAAQPASQGVQRLENQAPQTGMASPADPWEEHTIDVQANQEGLGVAEPISKHAPS